MDPGAPSRSVSRDEHEDETLRVYRETIRPLYVFVARRSGGDRSLAEDVCQEAWLRAIDSWRGKGPPADAAAWLRTVARRLLLNHFRRRRPAQVDADALQLDGTDLEVRGTGAAALLQWGLSRLRDGQARLLEAHHFDGRSLADLARELGTTERAVEGRLRRSRMALRAALAPHVGSDLEPGSKA